MNICGSLFFGDLIGGDVCEIIRSVGGSRVPVNLELFLCNPVLNPIEPHIHKFDVVVV